MPLIIDAYNLIGSFNGLAEKNKEESLIRKLISYQALSKKKISLVFDGGYSYPYTAFSEKRGGIIIKYAGLEKSADLLIKEMISKSLHARDLQIVTADREIINFALRKKCKVILPKQFLREITNYNIQKDNDYKNKSLRKEEIDYWLNIFENKKEL